LKRIVELSECIACPCAKVFDFGTYLLIEKIACLHCRNLSDDFFNPWFFKLVCNPVGHTGVTLDQTFLNWRIATIGSNFHQRKRWRILESKAAEITSAL
jgi:hypothetical protein